MGGLMKIDVNRPNSIHLYDNATEKLVYNHAYKYAENEFLLQNAEKGKIMLYVICR